jgi:hypothetical protein
MFSEKLKRNFGVYDTVILLSEVYFNRKISLNYPLNLLEECGFLNKIEEEFNIKLTAEEVLHIDNLAQLMLLVIAKVNN